MHNLELLNMNKTLLRRIIIYSFITNEVLKFKKTINEYNTQTNIY